MEQQKDPESQSPNEEKTFNDNRARELIEVVRAGVNRKLEDDEANAVRDLLDNDIGTLSETTLRIIAGFPSVVRYEGGEESDRSDLIKLAEDELEARKGSDDE